jgi:bla regulator protein blaR1
MRLRSSKRVQCSAALNLLLALTTPIFGLAQTPDIAPVGGPTGNTNLAVIQTDFALRIDGEFVVGTFEQDKGAQHSDAAQNYWQGDFSTHEISPKGSSAIAGVHLLNNVGENFTVTARRGEETYEIEGNAVLLANGLIEFNSSLKHNGAFVGQQRKQALNGEKALIPLGAAAGHDLNFVLTQRRVDAVLPARHPLSTEPANPTASHSKPAEKLAYRRMKPPRYPPGAARAGVQGEVQVNVLVDAQGAPYSAEVFGIEPPTATELGGSAVAAALQWRYEPAVRDGQAVSEALLVPVSFTLRPDAGETLPTPDPLRSIGVSYRKLTPPVYPASAVSNQLTGTVFVRLELDSDGIASGARIEQISPATATELGDAALQAIRNWQFSPQIRNGQAIASEARIPIEFKLSDAPSAGVTLPVGDSEQPLEPVANSLQAIVVLPPPAH